MVASSWTPASLAVLRITLGSLHCVSVSCTTGGRTTTQLRVVGVRGHVFRSNFCAGIGQVFLKFVHGLVICLGDSGENIFWAKTTG